MIVGQFMKKPNKWLEMYEFLVINNFPNSLIPKKALTHTKEHSNWISL